MSLSRSHPVTRFARAIVLSSLCFAVCAAESSAQRAVFVVRHAEKLDQSEDAALSAQGLSRARALAELLRSSAITHIFTTQYRRTQLTAGPLATLLKVTPETSKAQDVAGLVARLRALPADAVALVVAHSDTVPQILTGLGWTGTVNLSEQDYDNVFLLVPRGAAVEPSVVRLKYGRRTGP